ncbi:FCD domain-containing protein [Streptomyces spongiae]|uniref:FCD domain-containing protein n=1 Tax=Streptomyces spongiae TaxID=565072 RepID=UPI002AD4B7D2|nr:FCD domain-containing protein [Streptomyces spongiae]
MRRSTRSCAWPSSAASSARASGWARCGEVRVTLELRGVARAIEDSSVRHDTAVLTAELDRWYAMREQPPTPDPRFVVQDERFHAELSRASGNPALTHRDHGVRP